MIISWFYFSYHLHILDLICSWKYFTSEIITPVTLFSAHLCICSLKFFLSCDYIGLLSSFMNSFFSITSTSFSIISCIFTLFFFSHHLYRKSSMLNIVVVVVVFKEIYLFLDCSGTAGGKPHSPPQGGLKTHLLYPQRCLLGCLATMACFANLFSLYPKYKFQTLFNLLKNSSPIMLLPFLSHGLIFYFLNKRAISKNSFSLQISLLPWSSSLTGFA